MIRILRLLLLAALTLAPAGRIGMAQAAAAPAAASGHCADRPGHAPAPAGDKRMTIDCMIACAALAAMPALFVAPMPVAADPLPIAASFPDPTGIGPEAEPPPPRFS
ncbi:MAG: hypothetical protein QOD42_191 [Sphingomonadales bacterium]|jgi:hypothetical protein|nr:hypothetical protein [Sphingomonadales bacterium]